MNPATATFASWHAARREPLAGEPDVRPRLSVFHLALGPAWTAAWAERQDRRTTDGAAAGTTTCS